MRCFWCHNPEGQHAGPELRYFPDRCIACGQCVTACPNHAHELQDGFHRFLRERCDVTGRCVESCYSNALQLEGRCMTVAQVMEEVLRDRSFYEMSQGGITLSGGEPALSREFAREVLQQCKNSGLHTAIETCGEYPWTSLESLLPVTDLIMMDIKQMSPDKHRSVTGQPNDRILINARRLALSGKPIVFRTPVVPTVNDSEEEIEQIARFISQLNGVRRTNEKCSENPAPIHYELLTFHNLATDKYRSLDLEYRASMLHPPTEGKMSQLLGVARRHGIEARIR